MDDAQRLAYEERREDERRQEREREEAYREELEQEDARRLARYDEAIRLLREAYDILHDVSGDPLLMQAHRGWNDELHAFLAAEGKVAG